MWFLDFVILIVSWDKKTKDCLLFFQSVQNKEGYDPIPRRSAPVPSHQVVATHSSRISGTSDSPTPKKSSSSSTSPTGLARSGLAGDIYLSREVNTSYDPRPRRSAPRPPL